MNTPPTRAPQVQLPNTKGLLLFVLPLPIFLAIFASLGGGEFTKLLGNTFGFGLFMLGAVLTRRGFARQRQAAARRGRRGRVLPYRLAGALTVTLASTVTALWGVGHSLLIALAFGATALTGYVLTYGVEPLPRRRLYGKGKLDKQVLEAIDQAERHIETIEIAADKLRDRELTERLDRIATKGRRILTTLEEDPKDLRRARKFLVVYLEGTQRVVEAYAKLHGKAPTSRLESNFRDLLASIEQTFDEQQTKLYQHDLLDLDVQIEVLEKQLKREGVI